MTDVQTIVAGLSKQQRRAVVKLRDDTWSTCAEAGVTGMAATLLCTRTRPLAERRWAKWGSDAQAGVKGGEGYEYSLTPLGLAVRQALEGERASQIGEQP